MVGRAASLQKKHKKGFGLPMLPSKNGVGRVWFGRGSRPFKMKHGEEFAQHHLQMIQNRPNMAQYRPLRNLYDGNLKQAYSRVWVFSLAKIGPTNPVWKHLFLLGGFARLVWQPRSNKVAPNGTCAQHPPKMATKTQHGQETTLSPPETRNTDKSKTIASSCIRDPIYTISFRWRHFTFCILLGVGCPCHVWMEFELPCYRHATPNFLADLHGLDPHFPTCTFCPP